MKLPGCWRVLIFLVISSPLFAQDSLVTVQNKTVTLKEVVVRSNLNVPAFIDRIKEDTTFYKAFRNLKVLGYTALNDIRMQDKSGEVKASLNSRTQQHTGNGCRWMTVQEEKTAAGEIRRLEQQSIVKEALQEIRSDVKEVQRSVNDVNRNLTQPKARP